MAVKSYANLLAGDTAPWFSQRSANNPRYVFDTAAGRYIVLCFLMSAGDERGKAALAAVRSRPQIFNDAIGGAFRNDQIIARLIPQQAIIGLPRPAPAMDKHDFVTVGVAHEMRHRGRAS